MNRHRALIDGAWMEEQPQSLDGRTMEERCLMENSP